ncbi:hypothetical protein [Pseudoalteromonas phenolica]|uniref:hypothetical protein n=1 Tax=Pseudoalteromonas phenolica TaxID=161398 RepID=UPI00384E13F1
MYKPSYLVLISFLFTCQLFAAPSPLQVAPAWVNADSSLSQAKSLISIDKDESKSMYVPAGSWIDLPDDVLSKTTVWVGQTQHAMRKLHPSELVCNQQRCQLAATQYNQILKLENHNQDWVTLNIKLGQFHFHRDPFRRAIKLPLTATKLSLAQDHEFYYTLTNQNHVSLYFKDAKKLKLSVRKWMSNLKQDNKVLVEVNGQPISLINVSNVHAPEYRQTKISTVNTDYFAVPKGSYLKITALGDAVIKLEQMHRGIYDQDAQEKQPEALLNPYWTENLEASFEKIYTQQDLSQISHFSIANASMLEQRRYQDLVSTVSTRRYAQVTNRGLSIESEIATQSVNSGFRTAAKQLYMVPQQKTLTSHQLKDTLSFDIGQFQRIRNQLFLYIQADHTGHLVAEYDNQRHIIEFSRNQNFNRIMLPVSLQETKLQLFSADESNIKVAVEVDDLLTLPNNPLLYLMQSKLHVKSPTLMGLLNKQNTLLAQAYLNNLPMPIDTAYKSRDSRDDNKLISKAMNLALSEPSKALPLLKELVNSNISSIALDAWRMRIDLLTQLDRTSTASAYLESLLQSKQPLLSDYAAKTLFTRYFEAQQVYKLQGLCAYKFSVLNECKSLTGQILLAQQKNLQALWTQHDIHNHAKTAQQGWIQNRIAHLTPLEEESKTAFDISHYGTVNLQGDTADYLAHTLSENNPLQIYAKQAVTLQLRVRTPYIHDGTQQQHWLHLDTQSAQSILPVFADVASTTQVQKNELKLSIASEAIIKLKKGQQLTVSSTQAQYLSINTLPDTQAFKEHLKSDAVSFSLEQHFANLIHNPNIDLKTLLTNALYRLSQDTLNNFEFSLLFARLENTSLSADLIALRNRIEHYGTWQPIEQYLNYSGTQLVDMNAITRRSFAEQLSRHTSQRDSLQGLLIRPNHTLNLDLSELAKQKVKLIFNFSAAELVKTNYANILVSSSESSVLWTVESAHSSELALTEKELNTGLISLRWMNPYVSQLLSVSIQSFQQGRWQDTHIDTRQLFYFAQEKQQISAQLDSDSLIKIERLTGQVRQEEIGFYPAGKINLQAHNSQLARVFKWQLDPNRAKTSFAPTIEPLIVEKPSYYHVPSKKPFYEDILSTDENLTHVEGLIRYNRAGIFESEQSQSARHYTDFGLRLRNKDEQHWYLLESLFTLDNQNYETFSINAQHNWLSKESHWFSEARINNRWQNDTQISESHLTSNLSFKIGETWRDDNTHRHQWWWQPFYYYTSITADEYIADRLMSPSMFSFYREDHMHGWRAAYQYRYQPWSDNQISASFSTTSNEDWTSFDNLGFDIELQQFYQGHIFTLAGASQYKFADQHRPNNTWQYLTQVSWQTLFDFSEQTAGWIKLSWTQDWFRKDHSLRLEINLGNLQNTGFGPFAHDEILFESLQLTHFLEQDIYDK